MLADTIFAVVFGAVVSAGRGGGGVSPGVIGVGVGVGVGCAGRETVTRSVCVPVLSETLSEP
jgi:hypothetical protein